MKNQFILKTKQQRKEDRKKGNKEEKKILLGVNHPPIE